MIQKSLLKELRISLGLTLRQVESSTKISNSYLSQLESGKIKKPSAQVLYLLSKLYGTTIEVLLIDFQIIKETNIEPAKPTLEQRLEILEKEFRKYQDNPTIKSNDFFHPDTKFC